MRAALDRWAPWVAGLVLLGGIAVYAAMRVAGSSPSPTAAPAAAASEPTVPLAPQARAVARQFVATAVARRRLGTAWRLAAPSLRGDLTLAQWRAGDIPVPPYPVAQATASYTVQASHAADAVLRVAFLPRKGSSAQPGGYTIDLVRLGGRWLVASYTPASLVAPGSG